MHQRYILSLAIGLILFFSIPLFYVFNYSQSINTDDQKVVYDLPYPGILPDNILYPIKMVRDRMLELATSDNLRKAQLYLILSDKRLAMAQSLATKGKRKLAVSTVSKGEKYALKIPPLLKQSAEQGVAPQDRLVDQMKLSNKYHQKAIQDLMKDFTGEERTALSEVLTINKQVGQELEKLH